MVAGWVWFSAFVTLAPALFLLEYLAFGVRWGFLTGTREIDPTFWNYSLQSVIFSNIFMGLVASSPLALAGFVLGARRRMVLATLAGFVILLHIAADTIATSYQINFGATWGPGEAFRGLLYHPVETPLIYVTATLAFAGLIKRYWRAPSTDIPMD